MAVTGLVATVGVLEVLFLRHSDDEVYQLCVLKELHNASFKRPKILTAFLRIADPDSIAFSTAW